MIYITINHNNDEISIKNDAFKHTSHINIPVKNSTSEYRKFLIELFNMMDISDVELNEIDEDTCRNVESW